MTLTISVVAARNDGMQALNTIRNVLMCGNTFYGNSLDKFLLASV